MTWYNIPQGRCPVLHHLQGMAQNAEKKFTTTATTNTFYGNYLTMIKMPVSESLNKSISCSIQSLITDYTIIVV